MRTALRTPLQLRLRENQIFLALAIIVGILSGLSAVLFALSIDRVSRMLFGLDPSATRLFLVPTGISLITGVLLARVFPDVRGSGVPQTEAAYHLHGGVVPARVGLGKFLTGVLCVGSGHSMGREGPSVQIGASVASTVGRWLNLSPERMKALLPIGAAGALSAAFNTPVAAVLFALEEIIGSMNAPVIGPAVVASVTAVVVERAILGNEPLFHVPAYQLVHPGELVFYAVLGAVGGVVSVAFCRALLSARAAFKRLPAWTQMLQPAIGGAIIGAILIVRPEVMGVGYEYVNQALTSSLVWKTLLILGAVKAVATIVSYSSGNAGGIFAPTLFIGAMLGGAVGTLAHRVAPFPTAAAGAYALVGMGALFAGIIRAPMTSVFMVFEITQDYQILVPLMVANLLSYVIARRAQPTPVYHALLLQDGVHLPTADTLADSAWTVGRIMTANPRTFEVTASVPSVLAAMTESGDDQAFVTDDGRIVGVVDIASLQSALQRAETPALDALARPAQAHVHADHRLDVLFDRWRGAGGLLPVVSRTDVSRLEGVIRLSDLTDFLASSDLGDLADAPDRPR